jgi:2'-5' RNA ligase
VAGDGRIRLFCALQLPDDASGRLAEWQAAELSGTDARLVPRGNLHITLAFLGSRPPGEVEPIVAELRSAAAGSAPFELRPLRYRETKKVGMIVLDDPSGAATAFAEDVQARLERLGVYRRERRRWLPHVTVSRFRSAGGLSPTVANTCSIHVVRSALYRSTLGAGEPRYDALETAALGGR